MHDYRICTCNFNSFYFRQIFRTIQCRKRRTDIVESDFVSLNIRHSLPAFDSTAEECVRNILRTPEKSIVKCRITYTKLLNSNALNCCKRTFCQTIFINEHICTIAEIPKLTALFRSNHLSHLFLHFRKRNVIYKNICIGLCPSFLKKYILRYSGFFEYRFISSKRCYRSHFCAAIRIKNLNCLSIHRTLIAKFYIVSIICRYSQCPHIFSSTLYRNEYISPARNERKHRYHNNHEIADFMLHHTLSFEERICYFFLS